MIINYFCFLHLKYANIRFDICIYSMDLTREFSLIFTNAKNTLLRLYKL